MPVKSEAAADVAIIGAGPAGLTAAYLLTKAGYSVIVIEKDPVYVGGISRTVEHNGFRFDIGGHRFFSKSREVVDLWNEILPDDFIQRPRMSRIYYDGKYYAYPLRGVRGAAQPGHRGVRRCACCPTAGPAVPAQGRRRASRTGPSTSSASSSSTSSSRPTPRRCGACRATRFRADWAAQRIKGLSLGGAVLDGLKRSLGLNKKPNDGMETKTLLETFRYPRKGPGMMWEAARDFVVAKGNRVLMDHALQQLSFDEKLDRWRVAAKSGDGKSVVIKAAHVISSAPIRELRAESTRCPRRRRMRSTFAIATS